MEWRFINDFDNKYKIYKNGDVLSLKTKNPKLLKPRKDTKGYFYVGLRKDNKQYNKYIHRLLGIYFIDNPYSYTCIDHINRNPIDNSLDNLRWINHSGNMRNRKTFSKFNFPRGVKKNNNTEKFNAAIRMNGKNIHLGYFDTIEEASNAYEKKYNEIMKF